MLKNSEAQMLLDPLLKEGDDGDATESPIGGRHYQM